MANSLPFSLRRINRWTSIISVAYKRNATSCRRWSISLDDTCLLFQHKGLERIREEHNKNLSSICDWFVDKKHSLKTSPIYVTGLKITTWAFTSGRIKLNLFLYQKQKKEIGIQVIQYGDVKIKQESKVTYLRCELDESL